jgi:hypothetical protein
MSLRIRQEVQALLRKDSVSLKEDGSDVSVSGFVASVAQFDAAVRKLLSEL